jgi:hypothetical protein
MEQEGIPTDTIAAQAAIDGLVAMSEPANTSAEHEHQVTAPATAPELPAPDPVGTEYPVKPNVTAKLSALNEDGTPQEFELITGGIVVGTFPTRKEATQYGRLNL